MLSTRDCLIRSLPGDASSAKPETTYQEIVSGMVGVWYALVAGVREGVRHLSQNFVVILVWVYCFLPILHDRIILCYAFSFV